MMVTVRNAKGVAMLDEAIASGRVEIIQDGGHGGASLPSSGDRAAITMKTVAADSMVRSLTDATFVPGAEGAPPLVANVLAKLIAKALPTGLEFGRFSIDVISLSLLPARPNPSPTPSNRRSPPRPPAPVPVLKHPKRHAARRS